MHSEWQNKAILLFEMIGGEDYFSPAISCPTTRPIMPRHGDQRLSLPKCSGPELASTPCAFSFGCNTVHYCWPILDRVGLFLHQFQSFCTQRHELTSYLAMVSSIIALDHKASPHNNIYSKVNISFPHMQFIQSTGHMRKRCK